jgi:hypothetical protein
VRVLANAEIAEGLERVADLLEVQGASSFRVNAYRGGARTLRTLERPVADLLEEGGRDALQALPGIGRSLARQIAGWIATGHLTYLDRLEGEASPERLFSTLPGVGEALARRLHETLGADTLEELEIAAHDGRLETVPGVGPRRARAIRSALEHVLRFRTRYRRRAVDARRAAHEGASSARPSVALLLDVDREYREKAREGRLRRIAPRRFNPEGRAWLPVLHRELRDPRDPDGTPWSVTALFSNTARAHQLSRTGDWVVVYAERDGEEDRATVVTESRGALAGRRVVRGREEECAALLRREGAAPEDGPAPET